jgi:hypothetical protein
MGHIGNSRTCDKFAVDFPACALNSPPNPAPNSINSQSPPPEKGTPTNTNLRQPPYNTADMAPTRKRTSLRARSASKSNNTNIRAAKFPRDAISHPNSTFVPPAHILDSLKPKADGYVEYDEEAAWKTSKKDKRAMRHNVLMNKVRDAGVRKTKPRRPNNKLKTDMESLADALPTLEGMVDGESEDDGWEGVDSGEEDAEGMNVDGTVRKQRRRRTKKTPGEGKMEMKSLKHKPGAMKRKRVLEGREMERFGKNLVQLVGSVQRGGDVKSATGENTAAAPVVAAQADRWAALRGFIGSSMEQNPAFVKG